MDKYAVFGNPIAQSKSPLIHAEFADQTKQVLEYNAIGPDVDRFHDAITTFIEQGGKGANVTAPFKEQAFSMATKLTERAQLAKAVNTLVFNKDGSILGDNTDGAGLIADLLENKAPLNRRVLLIGAGGAARGVIKPLLAQQPELLVITNRTHAKAEELASHFDEYGRIAALTSAQLESEAPFDVVINSSSSSLFNEIPAVTPAIFKTGGFAYDMSYKAENTVFIDWALASGAETAIDGLGMLVGQAAESFNVWRGVMPNKTPVENKLRELLKVT
ncbi:shikimate dehydrogenase [Thalassotalea euphylliae]|uniref:shikimate dehydrogenase n=1 Tax=Thalassotalea euphylliae TaxID=1655234 RepID=UPI003624D2A3